MYFVEGLEDELVAVVGKLGGHLFPELDDDGGVLQVSLFVGGGIAQVGLERVVVGVQNDVHASVQGEVYDSGHLIEVGGIDGVAVVHVAGPRGGDADGLGTCTGQCLEEGC